MSYVAGSQLAPGTTVSGYRVEALIGRGGMGAAYRASDERLGRKVALKVIAPELAQDERFRERFLRESKIAASLDHPHVIPIHQAGEEKGLLFDTVSRVDLPTPGTGEGVNVASIAVGDGPVDVALDETGVWVANSLDRTVSRIDPETNEVVATIGIGNVPERIAAGEGAVWVTVRAPVEAEEG